MEGRAGECGLAQDLHAQPAVARQVHGHGYHILSCRGAHHRLQADPAAGEQGRHRGVQGGGRG
eukprot:8740688-Alexandrium_andersonii.AAC.1